MNNRNNGTTTRSSWGLTPVTVIMFIVVALSFQCKSIKILAPLWHMMKKKIARNNRNDFGTWLLGFPTDSLSPLSDMYIENTDFHRGSICFYFDL